MNLMITCYIAHLLAFDSTSTPPKELIAWREGFRLAVVEKQIDSFFEQVKETQGHHSTCLAYQACAFAMKAQINWNPISKWYYIRKYNQLMNRAVALSAANLEVRFLRFSMEYYLPKWLEMSIHLQEDKEYISSHVEDIHELQLHEDYAHYILYFLKQTNFFDQSTLESLQTALTKP